MKTELIANFLKERLQTTVQMENAADLIEVSLATMYRYKANPDGMPLGKLAKLADNFGFPIEGTAAWSKTNVIQGERRRLELEKRAAEAKGIRFVVTPAFSVNAEVPEFTKKLWEYDYPMGNGKELPDYLALRQQRQSLYTDGNYQSYEIIIAACYRDFFGRRGRFKGVPEDVWRMQHQSILKTAAFPHVHRRIYLQNTPELPVFTCYSNQTAVIRVDDFTVEFGGELVVKELSEIFQSYFEAAEIKTDVEVRQFLENPS